MFCGESPEFGPAVELKAGATDPELLSTESALELSTTSPVELRAAAAPELDEVTDASALELELRGSITPVELISVASAVELELSMGSAPVELRARASADEEEMAGSSALELLL